MASAAGKSGPGLAKVLQFSFGQKMAADHTPSAPALTCTSGPTSFLFPPKAMTLHCTNHRTAQAKSTPRTESAHGGAGDGNTRDGGRQESRQHCISFLCISHSDSHDRSREAAVSNRDQYGREAAASSVDNTSAAPSPSGWLSLGLSLS